MRKFYKVGAIVIVVAIAIITMSSGNDAEFKLSGGRGDLVDELYDQAVKQNDNLKSIEESIEKFYKNRKEAVEKFNEYSSYNTRYYSDARTKIGGIANSQSKQKAIGMLDKSEAAYKVKLTDWQNTITSLDANARELNDLHILLQIATTEPMIQRYQNSDRPDNTKAKEVNAELVKIIERIKAIVQ